MPLRKKKKLEQKSNTSHSDEDKSSKPQEKSPLSTDKEPEDIKKSESSPAEQNVQEKPEKISDTADKKLDDNDAEKVQEKSTDVKDKTSDTKSADKSQSSDDPEVDGIYKCVSQPPTFERHLVSRYQFIKQSDTYAMRKGSSVNNGPKVLVMLQSEMLDMKDVKMEEDYHIVSTTSGRYHILYPSLSEILYVYKQ